MGLCMPENGLAFTKGKLFQYLSARSLFKARYYRYSAQSYQAETFVLSAAPPAAQGYSVFGVLEHLRIGPGFNGLPDPSDTFVWDCWRPH